MIASKGAHAVLLCSSVARSSSKTDAADGMPAISKSGKPVNGADRINATGVCLRITCYTIKFEFYIK